MLNGVSGTHNKSAAHIAPGGVRALGAFHTRFGDRPGSYTIGVSYLSQQRNWITIPQVSLMQAGAIKTRRLACLCYRQLDCT